MRIKSLILISNTIPNGKRNSSDSFSIRCSEKRTGKRITYTAMGREAGQPTEYNAQRQRACSSEWNMTFTENCSRKSLICF